MKKIKKTKLPGRSFEEVLKNLLRDSAFRKAYQEELMRRQLAKQIRGLRTRRRLTQKMVAQKAGMPQSVIARIESGESGISVDTLGRVAHAFGKEIQLV